MGSNETSKSAEVHGDCCTRMLPLLK